MFSSLIAAADAAARPAGGAATGEIAFATVSATIITLALLYLGLGHRRGTVKVLGRIADFSERASGLPGWAAFPAAVAAGSLLTAVFGMYWDISLHIDQGRDEGPLANPAHYFILFGLYGIFTAGFLAMVLPTGRPSTSSIRIGKDWYAPLGGVLIAACGAFSLIGFPLDDVWHRIFGQDVTLWGPTHLMLIGGASMTLLGIAVLTVEGRRFLATTGRADAERGYVQWLMMAALPGGLMAGLSTFQAEFDFGVPQFQMVFQPLMLMMAAGVGLVATRIWLGKGAALAAVGFFILVRGTLAVLVGPVLGETTPHFPLYLAEALIVEAVALAIASRERPLAFGAWCGALIGTVGLAAEWGWSHLWMPLPWSDAILTEIVVYGVAIAMASSLIGAWIGARLVGAQAPRTPSLRGAAVAGSVALAAFVAFTLHTPEQAGISAEVSLAQVAPEPERTANATVRLSPRDAADDAAWLTVTAWQGGDKLVVDRLKKLSPGVYRSTKPVPLHGEWKALVRLHTGNHLLGVPLFLPEDAAIPAPEVPAPARFTRTFVEDHEILQREQKDGVAASLPPIAYGAVVAIALSLLALLAWGLHRLSVTDPARRRPPGGAEPDPTIDGPHKREPVLSA